MKVIKESKSLKEAGNAKSASIVKQMELEWPQMTKEFKRLQHGCIRNFRSIKTRLK